DAIDPDKIEQHGGTTSVASQQFVKQAVAPIATNPDLRNKILAIQRAADQTIDTVSQDKLLFAGADAKTTEAARDTVRSLRDYISASGSVDQEHLEADNVLGPVYKAFGDKLWSLMEELNLTLAA